MRWFLLCDFFYCLKHSLSKILIFDTISLAFDRLFLKTTELLKFNWNLSGYMRQDND